VLPSFTIQNVSAQPSQETWQTFKDPKNKFSVEYPSSRQLKPAEN
jgi:hypothetical protein